MSKSNGKSSRRNPRTGDTPLPGLLSRQYRSLRAIAERILKEHRAMQKAAGPDRMSPTSLVAEATLRLLLQRTDINNDDHLNGLAALTMRRALIDGARRRRTREQAQDRLPEPTNQEPADAEAELRQVLEVLQRIQPRQAQALTLVGLRSLSPAEAARKLGVSEATLRRDLRAGRAWLTRRVRGD
jgi:RNA polymerase sigma factor (TIGR02999 family)